MLATKIIVFFLLSFATALITLYCHHTRKPIRSYIWGIVCLICIVVTSASYNTLMEQNQRARAYQKIENDEWIRTDMICFKDGSLYDPNFYGNINLIEKSSDGFYRFYITRATQEGPRKILTELSCVSETEINKTTDCRQPVVQEFIHHEYLITPEGKICYETAVPKFVLTIPENAIKQIGSIEGS